jgi:hypothetical protein
MIGRNRPFNRTIFFGLVLLAQANIFRWVLERHSRLPEDPRDAIVGLLYGLAIGCLVLGIWRMNRRSPSAGNGCQANGR